MAQRQTDPRFTAHDLISAAASGYGEDDVLEEAVSSEYFTALGYTFEQPIDEDDEEQQQ